LAGAISAVELFVGDIEFHVLLIHDQARVIAFSQYLGKEKLGEKEGNSTYAW